MSLLENVICQALEVRLVNLDILFEPLYTKLTWVEEGKYLL